ncbi:NAD(P)/FAD-dependent oxidoreductase [Streptantibioticus ferralitis]|uniref:NAD(P)/FAD-dependent oxidoreductase n=1 Tax=Streptantibioticus ferralitis TaxID=236510 RepID=A0ABT5Z4B6_9ACTN|nr:NAD(P)/FAD-dependent oxidoreductase [Streptantibioticus ferralitis]MDF2258549.1 NAD(P)/FAD-dependent oxidoreductase [Streptantibioticus ferralitis]
MTGTGYDTDLLVVGGGPAGLATAVHAARAGLDVVVCDPRRTPIDKACGEGLMPGGLARLHALGVDPPGVAFTGFAYLDGVGNRAETRFPHGPGRGVRRTALHAALATAATHAGAHWSSTKVHRVAQDADSVTAAGVRARWLVAADGLHSGVRRRLNVPTTSGTPRRFGLRRHWRIRAWSELVEVTWAAHAEAYVTPVDADLVGVALLYRPQRGAASPATDAYTRLLSGFPALAARLASAEPVGPVRGAGPLRCLPRGRVHGRVLLVGDAAGYEDALTGEGISLALAQAQAAVAAILAREPAHYERAWRRITRQYRLLSRALVLATTPPIGRRLIVPLCATAPALFRHTVNALAH